MEKSLTDFAGRAAGDTLIVQHWEEAASIGQNGPSTRVPEPPVRPADERPAGRDGVSVVDALAARAAALG